MKFSLPKYQTVLITFLLCLSAFLTLIDLKSVISIPLDYLCIGIIMLILISMGKFKKFSIFLFLYAVISLLSTNFIRSSELNSREVLFIFQLIFFIIFIFLISDDMLAQFRKNYEVQIIFILIVSTLGNMTFIAYTFFTQPYFGKINLAYSSTHTYHLYGFVLAMQFIMLGNLRNKLGTTSLLLSPFFILVMGARNATLLLGVALLTKKKIYLLLMPILIYFVVTADLSVYRSIIFSTDDGSFLGRIIKIQLAVENFSFLNIFVGQSNLFTLYWDNLFANLLVNMGLILALFSHYLIYERLRRIKYAIIVVILSTCITEFHLVPAGLFWGLIVPSILFSAQNINNAEG